MRLVARRGPRRAALALLLAGTLLLAGVSAPTPARAGATVTDCSNDSQLSGALAGGGPISFSCGTATIAFSGQKTISADTTVDGGGSITLSGANSYRLFYVSGGV